MINRPIPGEHSENLKSAKSYAHPPLHESWASYSMNTLVEKERLSQVSGILIVINGNGKGEGVGVGVSQRCWS